MTKQDLLKILNEVFISLFKDPNIILTEETTAADVENWDSLNNIKLILAIEKRLKIKKIRADEIQDWKNVGEMCDALLLKVNAASPPASKPE